MKRYYIKTFGCQMNDHDSRKMEDLLRGDGYAPADSQEEADLVVINTCSVRDRSYQKAVSEIGRMRDRKAVVAVTGCVVSHDADNIRKRFPFVDILLGPDHIGKLPEMVRRAEAGEKGLRQTGFEDISDYEFPSVFSTGEKQVKAYVTIMKGCDNVCSFCIVPFTRGKEVSRPPVEIVDEIKRLEAEGVREVMLLGQNVNSYGKGLTPKTSFARLLRQVDEETSIDRIRFTSPHPKDLSSELIGEYGLEGGHRRNTKLCPRMHLPIQSGSNSVLKRMRRSYTREVYLRKVEELRAAAPTAGAVPGVSITTDVIVGFPGETDEDFTQTISLLQEVSFEACYSFTYSPRPGTEAAKLTDDVTEGVKKERLVRLMELQAAISIEKNRLRIGRIESVLVEGRSLEGRGQLMGRTPQGLIINFDGGAELVGAILDVEVTGASAYSLKGRLCPSPLEENQ